MTKVEFTEKYRALENLLYRFAIKLTKSEAAAKDLLQETAMKAYTKRDSFSGTSKFKSWISTIMYNSFINNYRSRKRRLQLADNIVAKNSILNPDQKVVNNGYKNLIKADLDKHVEAIGDKSRAALKLHIQGYQYTEISEKLNIPTGTVKSRINYARKKARKSILQMGLYRQTA